jgi:hypothetical protein
MNNNSFKSTPIDKIKNFSYYNIIGQDFFSNQKNLNLSNLHSSDLKNLKSENKKNKQSLFSL